MQAEPLIWPNPTVVCADGAGAAYSETSCLIPWLLYETGLLPQPPSLAAMDLIVIVALKQRHTM